MSAIDLGTVASCGERMARARAMLEAMVAASGDLLTAGHVAAFVVVAEGNADLGADALGDVLALAVLRLAEHGGRVSVPGSLTKFYCDACEIKHEPPLHHDAMVT